MAITNWVQGDLYTAQAAKDYVDGKVLTNVPANALFTDTLYDDTALAGRVTTVESAITTLNGSGEGSVSKAVDDAIDDFATKITNNDVIDTFKELVDYAAENGSDLAAITGRVGTLETAVGSAAVEGDPGTPATGLYRYADDAITAAISALTIPTVPTNVSAFTNDTGYQTASDVSTAISGKANSSDLATVATTGSFADLTNIPAYLSPDLSTYESDIDAIFATV